MLSECFADHVNDDKPALAIKGRPVQRVCLDFSMNKHQCLFILHSQDKRWSNCFTRNSLYARFKFLFYLNSFKHFLKRWQFVPGDHPTVVVNFNVQSDRKGSHNGVPWQGRSLTQQLCVGGPGSGVLKEKIKKKKKRKKNIKHTDVLITASFICGISFYGGRATHYLTSPHLPVVRVFPCRWGSDVQQAESNFTL